MAEAVNPKVISTFGVDDLSPRGACVAEAVVCICVAEAVVCICVAEAGAEAMR